MIWLRSRYLITSMMIVIGATELLVAAEPKAPRFEGLGEHRRKVTTVSEEAQAYYDQGQAFLFAFNHDEAIRSFTQAAKLDPKCAMAYWGIAIANGPHINFPLVDEPHAKSAWAALQRAKAESAAGTPVERALIDALGKRYADPQPMDRKPLDEAYAKAMVAVADAFPEDGDVGALAAEAEMDLRPWDQWTLAGQPQPGTEAILKRLKSVLDRNPKHPLACHLTIHAYEASPTPMKACYSAHVLRTLQPGLGHMLHMPSHFDVRMGQWQRAEVANEKAIAADAAYRQRVPEQGFYRVYMAHNHHMLAFAAMMQGRSAQATSAIQTMLAEIPNDFLKQNGAMLDVFYTMPYEMHLRFGRWDAMLAEPAPQPILLSTTAMRHFARGVSFAAKKDVIHARAELDQFLAAKQKVPADAVFGQNKAADILALAELMLRGEVSYRDGQQEEGIAALREAVAHEDKLRYIEPPDWIQPVRHALGATLLDARRFPDAETAYREDLLRHPANGWSLFGLSQALRGQGKTTDAAALQAKIEQAWSRADVPLTTSCLCLP